MGTTRTRHKSHTFVKKVKEMIVMFPSFFTLWLKVLVSLDWVYCPNFDHQWTHSQQQSNSLPQTHLQMNQWTDVDWENWSDRKTSLLHSCVSPCCASLFPSAIRWAHLFSNWHGVVVSQSSLNKAVALYHDLIRFVVTKTHRLSQKWKWLFWMHCIQKQPSVNQRCVE